LIDIVQEFIKAKIVSSKVSPSRAHLHLRKYLIFLMEDIFETLNLATVNFSSAKTIQFYFRFRKYRIKLFRKMLCTWFIFISLYKINSAAPIAPDSQFFYLEATTNWPAHQRGVHLNKPDVSFMIARNPA